jgi:hypothetical protein
MSSKTLMNKLPDEIARTIYSYIYCDVMKELKEIVSNEIEESNNYGEDSDGESVDSDGVFVFYKFIWLRKKTTQKYDINRTSHNTTKSDIENYVIHRCYSCGYRSDNEYAFSVWGYCYRQCYTPDY